MLSVLGAPRLLIVPLLLCILLALVSCGGDDDDDGNGAADELTLEEYFGALDAIFETADAESDAALDEFSEASASVDEDDLDGQIAVLDDYLDATVATFEAAIADMEALGTPDEVEDAHDDFLDSVRQAVALATALQDDLEDVTSEEEATSLASDFENESGAVVERSDVACLELQGIADANSIAVDLDCED